MLLYLAAAGVGTLGIVDDDVVEASNLQRQVVHPSTRLGWPKVESARETIATINPDVRVVCHGERLTADNARALVSSYDVIADGSDNFETRFLLNDTCYFAKRPLVSGAVVRFPAKSRHSGPTKPPPAPATTVHAIAACFAHRRRRTRNQTACAPAYSAPFAG